MGDFLSFKTLNTDDELSAAEESEDETSQATDYDDKVGKVLKPSQQVASQLSAVPQQLACWIELKSQQSNSFFSDKGNVI